MVGDKGTVLGVDSAASLIELARLDAQRAKADNVRFEVVDAETHPFESTFDVCFARFGTMSFQSPVGAMKNLRSSVRRGGRLVILVWRALVENEWVKLPRDVMLRHVPAQPDDGPSAEPGPFSMADRGAVHGILESAGWNKVLCERVDAPVLVGMSTAEAVEFQLRLGPAGHVVREAGDGFGAMRPIITEELTNLLERFATPAGIVMNSSSWCVTARN
jgi:SAM-dependent methyltransferase